MREDSFTCRKIRLKKVKQNVVIYSIPPPLHTVYVYTVYLFTTQGRRGGGGRVEPGRTEEGTQFTKLGRKYQHD
jgi:hypothetical protein